MQQHVLQARQDLGGLPAVRAGADLQVVIRGRDAQLIEERLRHQVVIVLAGVHQDFLVPFPQPAAHRRSLHELRACAHDG